MKLFQSRTIGFWIGFVSAVLMLVADIVFMLTNHADKTFSMITFGLILAGVIFEILVLISKIGVFPLLSAICFGSALAYHLYIGLPTLSDVVNGVNFIGGNPTAVVVFGVCFLIGTIGSVISSFCAQNKNDIEIVLK